MRVAFILFDRLTALDFIGAYDPITRLKSMGFRLDMDWDLCSIRPGPVADDRGLIFQPTACPATLEGYDVIVLPGGYGTRPLCDDPAFLAWLRSVRPDALKASVCTGALLFGAAGWLRDRLATTHPKNLGDLRGYGARVVAERVVDTGDVITSGGVSSALDLGLHVVERLAGSSIRDAIRQQMDYRWQNASDVSAPTLPTSDRE